jgi:thiosulfate/3-mercaptopyruvate sulfurtransferase
MYTSLISVKTLSENLGKPSWVIVDCRFSLDDPERGHRDYRAVHIPNAVKAPYTENVSADGRFFDKDELQRRFRKLLGEIETSRAVFYCGSGVTACHNLLALYQAGIGHGKLYAGSWSEWITNPARAVVTID